MDPKPLFGSGSDQNCSDSSGSAILCKSIGFWKKDSVLFLLELKKKCFLFTLVFDFGSNCTGIRK
jgi:hypothetical protein